MPTIVVDRSTPNAYKTMENEEEYEFPKWVKVLFAIFLIGSLILGAYWQYEEDKYLEQYQKEHNLYQY